MDGPGGHELREATEGQALCGSMYVRGTESSNSWRQTSMVVPGPVGGWEQSVFHRDRVPVWEDGTFWTWMGVIAAQQCECASCHGSMHLKTVKKVNCMLRVFYHN